MRILFSLIFFIVFLSSCLVEEDDFRRYTISLKNESEVNLQVTQYYKGEVQVEHELLSGDSVFDHSFEELYFPGYFLSVNVDSMEFRFVDGKGYLTQNYQQGDPQFDFPSAFTPWGESAKFRTTDRRNYTFVITQEDYENAHVLPE